MATALETRPQAPPEPRRFGGIHGWDKPIGLAMVALPTLGIVIFGFIPMVYVIGYSFFEWSPLIGTFDFIGLDNFRVLLTDKALANSLRVTAVFIVLLMCIGIPFTLILALLLDQKLRGMGAFRTVYFSPVVVAFAAWAIVWNYLLAGNGGVNGLLARVGIPGPNWLFDTRTALVAIVFVVMFKGAGINMVLFLAALQSIPSELKEAARIDGANAWRTFFSITLPLLTPSIMMVAILTMNGAMDVFVPIQVMTQGGPAGSTDLISYYVYEVAFEQQRFGYGSTVGLVLFVITVVLTLLQWNSRRWWVVGER